MALLGGGQTSGPKKLHDAASATATGETLEIITNGNGSYSFVGLQITGTFTTVTVAFEATLDGSTWFSVEGESAADSATKATSATAVGGWRIPVIGYRKFRANLTWTSGTSITVWAVAVA